MEFNNSVNGSVFTPDALLESEGLPVVVFMTTIAVFAVPGNALIMIVQLKSRTKSSTDYYIFTMAVFDLLSGCSVAPLYIFRNIETIWILVRSTPFCRIRVSLAFMTTCASTLLLGAVAVDRYLLTCRLDSNTRMELRLRHRAKYTGIAIATVSVLFSSGNLVITWYDPATDACEYLVQYLIVSYVMSGLLMVIFCSVFVIIVVCYLRISLFIRQRHRTLVLWRLNQPTPSDRAAGRLKEDNRCPDYCNQTTKFSVESSRGPIPIKTSGLQVPRLKPNAVYPAIVHARRMEKLSKDEKTVNRTTLMLFLISAVYITSWLITWAVSFLKASVLQGHDFRGALGGTMLILQLFFLINVSLNPVFYFIMSTKFRESVLGLLRLKKD